MITVERLDKIEQDLEWARENADRSAQTRLFIHHVPFLLTILRPVAEALDAQIAEEEEYLAELEEEEIDLSLTTEEGSEDTETIADKVKGFFSSDDDVDASDEEEVGETDQAEWEETSDALEAESDPDKSDPEVGSSDEASEEVTE
jgi:hypothetical protein